MTVDEIVADLAGLLQNFNDREYSGDITAETLFFGDLGMVSIDAVVLGEQLEERYGRKLAFHQLLAGLQARGATDLSVGELAEFLHPQLNE